MLMKLLSRYSNMEYFNNDLTDDENFVELVQVMLNRRNEENQK